MANLSPAVLELINKYQAVNKPPQSQENNPTIHVDEIASKVAVFYEKARGIIDWKEEHLLRAGAIERTLKRKIFSKMDINTGNFSVENVAEPFVLELIRGGIFPNDQIQENKIKVVRKILDKYIFILNKSPKDGGKPKLRLSNWLLSIAACEIEEALGGTEKENALIEFMFGSLKNKIRFNSKKFKEEDLNIQIYIAVQRALFRLDSPAISYRLIKYKYKDWNSIEEKDLWAISGNIYAIWDRIEKELSHPLGDKIYKVCERHDAPYLLLGDIISENSSDIREKISDPMSLELAARRAYDYRLMSLKSRLKRAALYATISIFVTKILLALAIEIPLDKYIFGSFNLTAIAIDAIFPPFLMFVLIATIKPPGKENLNLVLLDLMKIVYPSQKEDIYEVKLSRRRNIAFAFVVKLIYFISFFVTLGAIVFLLHKLNFPIISYFIFILFISLIAFTGSKLRQRAKELDVIEEKEGLFTTLLDIFILPLIQLGDWVATRWKKYNVIAAIFNVLIDLPFSVFVELIEQWRYFLKEKKEKIH